MLIRFFIFVLSLLMIIQVNGQEVADSTKKSRKDKNFKIIALPVVTSSKATSLAFGAILQTSYKFKKSPEANFSSSSISFTYTLNKQMIASADWDLYFENNNRHRFFGEFDFKKYPDEFYGIGNRSQADDVEDFQSHITQFDIYFSGRVKDSPLHLGFNYRFDLMRKMKLPENSELFTNDLLGVNGHLLNALGPYLSYDTRDHIIFPTKGLYVQAYAIVDFFNFNKYDNNIESLFKVDVRKFWGFGKKEEKNQVICIQAYFEFEAGEIPFNLLSKLGGTEVMRGYRKGRYVDKHYYSLQAEYRFPLVWKFSGVAFAGFGDVWNSFDDLRVKKLPFSVGAGLRFEIFEKTKSSVRLDFTYAPKEFGFLLKINEAF